ncbi:hypothetical protein D3C85_1385770 [compost metagenome]
MRELAHGAKVARVCEVENRPKLCQPILNRCTRQGDAMISIQPANRRGLLCISVLDILSFVQTDRVPSNSAQFTLIQMGKRVGGQNQIVLANDFLAKRCSF